MSSLAHDWLSLLSCDGLQEPSNPLFSARPLRDSGDHYQVKGVTLRAVKEWREWREWRVVASGTVPASCALHLKHGLVKVHEHDGFSPDRGEQIAPQSWQILRIQALDIMTGVRADYNNMKITCILL